MTTREKIRILKANNCSHNKKELGYIAWHDWAEKHKGHQRQCPDCGLWLFREEAGKKLLTPFSKWKRSISDLKEVIIRARKKYGSKVIKS